MTEAELHALIRALRERNVELFKLKTALAKRAEVAEAERDELRAALEASVLALARIKDRTAALVKKLRDHR